MSAILWVEKLEARSVEPSAGEWEARWEAPSGAGSEVRSGAPWTGESERRRAGRSAPARATKEHIFERRLRRDSNTDSDGKLVVPTSPRARGTNGISGAPVPHLPWMS